MASASVLQDSSLQARQKQTVTLTNGRALGFAEFGSLGDEATPLFAFHGLPGSRLESASFHRAGCDLNVRVIGIDRPGLGLSSAQPNRVMCWVSLQADPMLLRVPHELPDNELLGVGVVSGMGHWHLGTRDASLELRVLLDAMAYAPGLARFMLNAMFVGPAQDPDPLIIKEMMDGATKRMKPSDGEFCEQPEVMDILAASSERVIGTVQVPLWTRNEFSLRTGDSHFTIHHRATDMLRDLIMIE